MGHVTLVLTAAPSSLRGELTRWFLEIAPGVYVGDVSRRVREQIWQLIEDHLGSGRAIISFSDTSEQGYGFDVLGHDKIPVDVDGLTLIRQPFAAGLTASPGADRSPPESWSIAARRRRYGRKPIGK
ncbi:MULTISPECIES: type I-E CRISPR-associated endoribonuclease Cas2e [Bowdeniella]|uniref:type I-E CRISPR-associated endoribonuclease Cas2e n=1 Tax=Bowdeniella TaxID=2767322 RepID=UPI000B806A32|nr:MULTISPECIES: type I-E CRISPR-associated endoribonuclease Cas2e [Bowdeniella]